MRITGIIEPKQSLQLQDIKIKPVVSNRFKLEQATEALSMLKEGKILGRGVINP